MLETIPDKMTLNDWQSENGNIFSYLIDVENVTYMEGVDADTMKFLFSSLYGQRNVRPFLESLSAQEVGRYIHQLYSDTWQKEHELFSDMMELEGESVIDITDNTESGTERTTNTNQTNKTSGFNSEEMVDDSGADIKATDGVDNHTNHTHKSINTSQSSLLSKADAVRRREFHHRICGDIATFITLSIY